MRRIIFQDTIQESEASPTKANIDGTFAAASAEAKRTRNFIMAV